MSGRMSDTPSNLRRVERWQSHRRAEDISELTDELTYLPSSHMAPKQLGKQSTSGRIIDPASDPSEQYGMHTVVKAFDEQKNERFA